MGTETQRCRLVCVHRRTVILAPVYVMWDDRNVRVTITKLRQDIFRLVDQALEGKPVEFTHRGMVLRIIPEKKVSKLSGLIGQKAVAPGADFETASRSLFRQMESEWEEDWSDL